jgi:hypothetical protein
MFAYLSLTTALPNLNIYPRVNIEKKNWKKLTSNYHKRMKTRYIVEYEITIILSHTKIVNKKKGGGQRHIFVSSKI